MLAIAGREDLWCAVCAAVDGSVELRVGPPPRRGLLRRRNAAGEAWLREQGYVPVIDAWSLPATQAGDATCASTLEAALERALGADPGEPLEHVLTHPGLLDGAEAPAPDTPLEGHVSAALRALVRAGAGSCSIGSGRPESLRAWVRVADSELLVERELPGGAESPGETWSEPLTPSGAERAAGELLRRVRAERPGTDSEPWFATLVTPDS
jgi:hypothetical protein